jgi:hypothetical protein
MFALVFIGYYITAGFRVYVVGGELGSQWLALEQTVFKWDRILGVDILV